MKNKLKGEHIGHPGRGGGEADATRVPRFLILSLSLCLCNPSGPWKVVAEASSGDLHRPRPLPGLHAGRPHSSCSPAFLLKATWCAAWDSCSPHCVDLGRSSPSMKTEPITLLGRTLVTTRYQVPGIHLPCLTSHLGNRGSSTCCEAVVKYELVHIHRCLEWCLARSRRHGLLPLSLVGVAIVTITASGRELASVSRFADREDANSARVCSGERTSHQLML